MTEATPAPKPKTASGWINVAVDYGPLLVFFATYKYFSPGGDDAAGEILAVINSTGAFIVAALVALAVSKLRLGKISPLLWLSTVLIVGFGALTIYFQDQRFIQWKPTIIYVGFGGLLIGGWLKGKPLLKYLLEAAFEGLSEEGWLKLSFNWGVFFLALAVLNTALIYAMSFESWLAAKLWLFMPLSFLFTFTQIPMLLKHGLKLDTEKDVVQNPPHE